MVASDERSLIGPDCPEIVFIENTNVCNMQCIMCPLPRMKRPKGYMDLALFRRICDEVANDFDESPRINFYFFGEPFMHPKAIEMIAYAKSLGLRMEFSTNLVAVTEEKAHSWFQHLTRGDNVVLSLDGYNKDEYERIRAGGKYRQLLEAYRSIVRAYMRAGENRPTLIPMCVHDWDSEEKSLNRLIADESKEMALRRVGDFIRKFTSLTWDELGISYSYRELEEVVDEFHRRYRDEGETHHYIDSRIMLWVRKVTDFGGTVGDIRRRREKGQNLYPCDLPWRIMVVMNNGDVTSCCHDLEGTLNVGNIHDQSLKEIWHGPRMQQIRSNLINDVSKGTICEFCQE